SGTRMKFLENNTTNLPNAVTADIRPVVTGAEQRFLDLNTVWLPGVADATAPITSSEQRYLDVNTAWLPGSFDTATLTTAQRWFLDVNTTMLPQNSPASAYMEDVTPRLGQNR